MCRNLILDEVGANQSANQVSTGTGNTGAGDTYLLRTAIKQIAEDLLDSINGPTGSHQIVLGQDYFTRFIQYYTLGTR